MTECELEIIKQYHGKISVKKIHELYLAHESTRNIYYHVSRLGLSKKRIHYKFSWSSDMAYFIGLVASDGNLYHGKTSYTIRISLQEKDKDILYSLQKIIGLGTIQLRKMPVGSDQYILSIHNKSLYNKLLELGLTPNKSKTLPWLDVPQEYSCDFVRGFFDGDGSISFNKASDYKGAWRAVFYSASKEFIYRLKEVLELNVGLTCQNLGKHTACYAYKLGRHDTVKLGQWMYYDGCLKLERKYDRFKQAMEIK